MKKKIICLTETVQVSIRIEIQNFLLFLYLFISSIYFIYILYLIFFFIFYLNIKKNYKIIFAFVYQYITIKKILNMKFHRFSHKNKPNFSSHRFL